MLSLTNHLILCRVILYFSQFLNILVNSFNGFRSKPGDSAQVVNEVRLSVRRTWIWILLYLPTEPNSRLWGPFSLGTRQKKWSLEVELWLFFYSIFMDDLIKYLHLLPECSLNSCHQMCGWVSMPHCLAFVWIIIYCIIGCLGWHLRAC